MNALYRRMDMKFKKIGLLAMISFFVVSTGLHAAVAEMAATASMDRVATEEMAETVLPVAVADGRQWW